MRRGGGLYSNFVSANDEENRPYRGAEIPPPSILQGRQGKSIKNFRFISLISLNQRPEKVTIY